MNYHKQIEVRKYSDRMNLVYKVFLKTLQGTSLIIFTMNQATVSCFERFLTSVQFNYLIISEYVIYIL